MEQNNSELIEALDNHTDIESAGVGGVGGENGSVGCWLTGDAIKNRREDVKANLTLLANAHGYEYSRGALESSGYIVIFEPDEN